MNEMVERLAEAMFQQMAPGRWVLADKVVRSLWLELARAGIAALREPTEAMQLAGHNVRNNPVTGLPTSCGTDEIYTAMIDAALKDEPTVL